MCSTSTLSPIEAAAQYPLPKQQSAEDPFSTSKEAPASTTPTFPETKAESPVETQASEASTSTEPEQPKPKPLTKSLPLAISSPTLLLNSIAQRYTKTSRIVMEYIDNSIDAAETVFNRKTGRYNKPVRINVYVGKNSVRVTDNCAGMDQEMLTRLISNVGDSTKRHSTFCNGQFGFGVHAFRAACDCIRFRTRSEDSCVKELEMNRRKEQFSLGDAPEDSLTSPTGTEVVLSKFDASWLEGLDPIDIVKEISYHFDRLLERKNMRIRVFYKDRVQTCKPFNYSKVKGTKIFKNYTFPGIGNVEVRLVVGTQVSQRTTHFVAKGRRINQIVDTKSFMRKSRGRYAIWAHPFICGYVEVNSVLDPVITRDEFRRTSTRTAMYDHMIADVEPRLHKLLKKANERRRVVALNRLEDVISGCFNIVIRKDNQRMKKLISYEDQQLKKRKRVMDLDDLNEKQPKKQKIVHDPEKIKMAKRIKKSNFGITFVDDLLDEDSEPMRAEIVGSTVQINVIHPDFKDRIRYSKDGRHPLVTERLVAYLANVAASAFKSDHLMKSKEGLESYREDHSKLFQEILDVTMSLEGHLREKLGLMQRQVGDDE